MKRFEIAGVCLLAIACMAGVSAASASAALPELYECAKAPKEKAPGKNYEGHYTGKHCEASTYSAVFTTKTKYELQPGIGKGKAFTGSGHGANLEGKGIGGISCTSFKDSGKFTTPTTGADIVAEFKGCEYIGLKCQSGAQAGEIATNPLSGTVGYLAGKGTMTPTVGASLKPESGEYLAVFHCQSEYFWVKGAVIGEVSPVNQFTKKATFTFKQTGIGIQQWEKFEGGPREVLEVTLCSGGCANPATEGVHVQGSEETIAANKGEELMLKA
jgi:hypothetical protein